MKPSVGGERSQGVVRAGIVNHYHPPRQDANLRPSGASFGGSQLQRYLRRRRNSNAAPSRTRAMVEGSGIQIMPTEFNPTSAAAGVGGVTTPPVVTVTGVETPTHGDTPIGVSDESKPSVQEAILSAPSAFQATTARVASAPGAIPGIVRPPSLKRPLPKRFAGSPTDTHVESGCRAISWTRYHRHQEVSFLWWDPYSVLENNQGRT